MSENEFTRIVVPSREVVTLGAGTYTNPEVWDGNGGAVEVRPKGVLIVDGGYIDQAVFADNSVVYEGLTTGWGGAIYSIKGDMYIGHAIFTNNTASKNGGAFNDGGNAIVSDTVFSGNTAEFHGGAYGDAGGKSLLRNVTFTDNHAGMYGGGICGSMGHVILEGTNYFSGNTAELGGGINCINSGLTIYGTTRFSGNSAMEGGAIYARDIVELFGTVILETPSDTFYSTGQFFFEISKDYCGCIEGYQYFINENVGGLNLCINSATPCGGNSYVIATGDFSDLNGKDTFWVTWNDNGARVEITINGDAVNFGEYSCKLEQIGDKLMLNIETLPTFKINADTRMITESTTFSASLFDDTRKIDYFCYTVDGKNWIDYSSGDLLTVTENHTSYTFRTIDDKGDSYEETVEFNNIRPEAQQGTIITVVADDLAVPDEKTVKTPLLSVIGGIFSLGENAELDAVSVALENGVLNVSKGNASVVDFTVTGIDNTISGVLEAAGGRSTAFVAYGAELSIDKAQFDELMTWTSFVSDGKVKVADSGTGSLTQTDINQLSAGNTVRDVDFDLELKEIHKLDFQANNVLDIRFKNGFGTNKDDTVTVEKNARINLSASEIDLAEGRNSIKVGCNAALAMDANLRNISKITVDSGCQVSGSGGKIQKFTSLCLGDVFFSSDRSGKISLGKFVDASIGNVTGNDMYADSITIGSNSSAFFGSIEDIRNLKLSSGQKYSLSADGAKIQGQSLLNASGFSCTGNSAVKLQLGDNTGSLIQTVKTGTGNDVISIGKYAESAFDTIDFGDGNNSLKVGADSDMFCKKLDFGTGNDTLSIGKNSRFDVRNAIDFSSGKDSIVVGDRSEVILKSGSAGSIKKFTIGKEAEAYLSSELYMKVTKTGKDAKVWDIGELDTAQNFTNIADETGDNDIAGARKIAVKEDYHGWLCGELDDSADYFKISDTAEKVQWDNFNNGLKLSEYDSSGNLLNEIYDAGTFNFDSKTAYFSVSFAEDRKDAVKYQVSLLA